MVDVNVFLCGGCLCDSPHLCVIDACVFDGNVFLFDGCLCV